MFLELLLIEDVFNEAEAIFESVVGCGWMGLENEIVGQRQETRDIHSSEGTFIPCGQSTTVNNITSAFNM